MALYGFRLFSSRPLRPANLKPTSLKTGVFSRSFSSIGPLSIFDVFPRTQLPSEETLVETKGQEKKKAEEKKNESDSQAHKPVIDGEYGSGSEASPGQTPLKDVDSTAIKCD